MKHQTIPFNILKKILLEGKSKYTVDDTKMVTVDELASRVDELIAKYRTNQVISNNEIFDEQKFNNVQKAVDELKHVLTEATMRRHIELENSIADAVKEISFIKKTQGDSLKTILDFLEEDVSDIYVIEKLGSKIGPIISSMLAASKAKVDMEQFAIKLLDKVDAIKKSGKKLTEADTRFINTIEITMAEVTKIPEKQSIVRKRAGDYYQPDPDKKIDAKTKKQHFYTVDESLHYTQYLEENIWSSIKAGGKYVLDRVTHIFKQLLTRSNTRKTAVSEFSDDILNLMESIVNYADKKQL